MEFTEILKTRRSIRAFRPDAVEPNKLDAVIAAALLAPSAGSLQAFGIHVVRNESMRQKLAGAAFGQEFVAQAPTVLVISANRSRARHLGKPSEANYSLQDAILAAAYAQLAATDQGLASCWIGGFDSQAAARALKLPEHLSPAVLLPIGYAAESPDPSPRRPKAELVTDLGA